MSHNLSYGVDICQMAATCNSSCIDETYLYTVDSANSWAKWDIESGRLIDQSVGTMVAGNAGMALITAATGIIVSSTNSSVTFIDINTKQIQTISSGASTVRTPGPQQVSANKVTNIALATKSSTNSLMKINIGPNTVSSISPAFGGAFAHCVLADEVSGVWFVGTEDGKVHEVTAGGTINKTITIPLTPNAGTSPTTYVTGLAFKDPYLLVATLHGVIYYYHYWTGAILYKINDPENNDTTHGTSFSEVKNGLVVVSPTFASTGQGGFPFKLLCMNSKKPVIDSTYWVDNEALSATPRMIHINSTRAVINNSTNSSGPRFFTMKFDKSELTSLSTRAEYPEGVLQAARIIRVRGTIGNKIVESDVDIPAADTSVPIYNNRNYTEIALISPGGTEKIDIREVTL